MKSKSDRRVPKFSNLPLDPNAKHVQTNPLVWIPAQHGFPYWFKPMAPDHIIHPFYTPHALAEAAHQGATLPEGLLFGAFKVKELRARQNPWHPSGRLERLVLEGCGLLLTLKFNGEDEQIECIAASKLYAVQAVPVKTFPSKYKGPRATGDTKSAVSEKPHKRS